MRADAIGFFWNDTPEVKEKKEVVKRTPPNPVWLREDYLPGLEEAQRFPVHIMSDDELIAAAKTGQRMVFDVEVYRNYFCISFMSLETGWVASFYMYDGHPNYVLGAYELDINRVGWILNNFTVVGFNSWNYDLPIVSLALNGKSCKQIKDASDLIIYQNWRPSDVLKQYKTKALKCDHIDLIEVAPLRGSLKIYGGRLNTPRMQDLPFHPEAVLTPPQTEIVRWYNVNDLVHTAILHEALKQQIKLREDFGKRYELDLRSRSDAQMAEAIISAEMQKLTGYRPQKPEIAAGTVYFYNVPQFIQFQTPLMNWALDIIRNARFIVGEDGAVGMPPELSNLELRIGNSVYRMGIGGLHSTESCVTHVSDENWIISDRDVVSYYPMIILNLGLYPKHLGPAFLNAYRNIVNRRVAAKKAKIIVEAESLKITVNGSFGKFGNRYSILYSPDLLTQVTITGQLSLLMLIERLELMGIPVVSANTDGIVIKCPRPAKAWMDYIVKQWEIDTGFETEEAVYRLLCSRDVNNYIAVKEDGSVKGKGALLNAWREEKLAVFRMHKNPESLICVMAIESLLTNAVPVQDTIRACKDITKFVTVRNVTGGAVKDGEYLGKTVRWYYASGEKGEIIYARSGNKVPRSEGAKPLMQLPSSFPDDVDYDFYVQRTQDILEAIGYAQPSAPIT